MVQRRFTYLAFALVFLMFFPGQTVAKRLSVFVSIAPQKYFVQQIGKDLVDVGVLVKPGADPHTYEPKPRQMVAMARAQLYFAIGVGFEDTHLNKIVSINPELEVVHTDRGITKIAMARHGQNGEKGDIRNHRVEGHRHLNATLDPHIWLSPTLVKRQAAIIKDALIQMDPGHRNAYVSNHERFMARIDALDARLRGLFDGHTGLRFIVFHPSWGYFAHDYGLHQIPIEVEGKDIKPAELKTLIENARQNGIRVVFAQPQFSAKSARLIAGEIGGKVVVADPLAADWLVNLQAVAQNIKMALR